MMKQSEITLLEAIDKLDYFCPVKIMFNDIVLYNDYDDEVEVAPGIFGESKAPLDVIPERLWQIKNYIVTDIDITIVELHHSIIKFKGRYASNLSQQMFV